jgi:hypothetical protein
MVAGVRSELHEIDEDVLLISTYVEPAKLIFNKFLGVAEQPSHPRAPRQL